MTAADEHIPSPDLRDEIVSKAVLPWIAACAARFGCPQTIRGVVRVRWQDVESFGVADGFWTIRLIVRHTIDAARDVFRVQALIPEDDQTGFCGFRMRGETRRLADRIEVVASGCSECNDLGLTRGIDDWR